MSAPILQYEVEADSIDVTTWRDLVESAPLDVRKCIRGVGRIYKDGVETDIEKVKDEIWDALELGRRYRLLLVEAMG